MKYNIPYRIISAFGYNYKRLNSRKTEVIYYCPECANRKGSPDTSGHLYVNLKSFKFHCVRCEYSGMIGDNIKLSESQKYDIDRDKDVEDIIKEFSSIVSDKNEFNLKIPIDKVTSSKRATEYLINRGFTYDQMMYYDMRVGNLNQEFGRIIIPNRVNKLVYTDIYSARTYIDQTPKYHNPTSVKKSDVVFNLHRIRERTPIILVEGALTAVAAGYHAVASLGKSLSWSQASQIVKKNPSIIYVNYDYGAEDESRRACKMIYRINPNILIKEVFMKDDRDAADLSRCEYVDRLQNSIEYRPLFSDMCSLVNDDSMS